MYFKYRKHYYLFVVQMHINQVYIYKLDKEQG